MAERVYVETFDDGPGGWLGWDATGGTRLEIRNGAMVSRSPWWVDCNHAPPGAGYLHLLYCLMTTHATAHRPEIECVAERNRFVDEGFPTDFTNARMTPRLKGEVDARGAQLVLLLQGDVGPRRINSAFTGQPFDITPDWSDQTVTLVPDDGQWTCLGSRHDRTEMYGEGPIAPLLADVNCDLILVLFPLDVVPVEALNTDMHRLRAGRDYEVDRSGLPEGFVMLDTVRIECPG